MPAKKANLDLWSGGKWGNPAPPPLPPSPPPPPHSPMSNTNSPIPLQSWREHEYKSQK